MRLLAIETATAMHSVAVVENGQLLATLSYEAQGHRGGVLLPTVDQILTMAGVAARDLDAVAVSLGPGSFTGLRVGLATAKGVALGAGAAVVGVSTLEVLATGYAMSDGYKSSAAVEETICALLDAYRGELYMALFRRVGVGGAGGVLERMTPDVVAAPDVVVATMAVAGGPIHVIGNGAARYRDQLDATLGGRASVSDEGIRAVPSAAWVARLGARQFVGENTPDAEVALIYLRRAEAEGQREKGLLKSPLAKVAQ